jgi:hypothetical protein
MHCAAKQERDGITMTSPTEDIRARALGLLEDHWDDDRGHTYPNLSTYPHQWLWDSCFAAICWDAVGRPERGLRELTNAMSAQFADGFVPHIRYAGTGSGRGPRSDVSSYTQPPIFAHAARVLSRTEAISADLLERVGPVVRRAPVGDRGGRLPALGHLGGGLPRLRRLARRGVDP